ncbi:MAG TPA: alcohol dehydrogenase [Thioalkalivibrio sp.]|nr:alcohol dehydrogenase [Thioalkalivibrio sp.]
MNKAVILGQRRAGIVEVPRPRAVENWAVVKVHVTPMCTEYKRFLTGPRADVLGHEAAGEIVEVAQPGRVRVGDRVVAMPLHGCGVCPLCVSGDYIYCQNAPDFAAITDGQEGQSTYAQYLLKPDWLLMPIPDDVSLEHGSLACCALGPSYGAFRAANLGAIDTVLITGAGPVGLGALTNARLRGARAIVVESVPFRVERARAMGAAAVIDPRDPDALEQIMALTCGVGVDVALDCSGVVAAQRLCVDAARRRGRVAFIGECHDELPIRVSPDLIRKGLTIIGNWHYNLADYEGVMGVIRRSPLLDLLVSHVLPMSRIQEAFELSASQQCAKVLLKPWE